MSNFFVLLKVLLSFVFSYENLYNIKTMNYVSLIKLVTFLIVRVLLVAIKVVVFPWVLG